MEKTIFELLEEIISLTKNMEEQCKDLRKNAFEIFPHLEAKEETKNE